MNLRKKTSRQVRGGERVQSLIFDLSTAEFRAVALRDELIDQGLTADQAAWSAVCTLPKPSALFVSWVSDGHLMLADGHPYPANHTTALALDDFLTLA